jgi:hypothetical protein
MEVERTYWFWLIAGPVEFAIFCGLPALIIMASWPFLKRHSEIPLSVSALAAAFVIIFLFLDISGIIRGEVGRIWMMLAPFPSLLVGAWLAYVTYDPELQEANRNRSLLRGGSAILLSTALFTAAIGLRWHVIIMEWNL